MSYPIYFQVFGCVMGKDDNRRTFKMNRKKAQAKKKLRIKSQIAAAISAAAKKK